MPPEGSPTAWSTCHPHTLKRTTARLEEEDVHICSSRLGPDRMEVDLSQQSRDSMETKNILHVNKPHGQRNIHASAATLVVGNEPFGHFQGLASRVVSGIHRAEGPQIVQLVQTLEK